MIGATTGMMPVNRSSAMPAAAVATPRFEPPVAITFFGWKTSFSASAAVSARISLRPQIQAGV